MVATLDALLRHAGHRVGRYTSPHLVDFRERIVVDGVPMPPAEIVRWLATHGPLVDELGATFFEVTTAMAFDWFAHSGVDVAVIEVGLGGRLDATNVVHPVCAGVTSIGLDHQEYLGDTVARVAAEKAGIFKTGAPAVVGATQPAAHAVLDETARRVAAEPILTVGRDFTVSGVEVGSEGTSFTLSGLSDTPQRLRTPLMGAYQADNAATALAMLKAAGTPWSEALTDAAAGLDEVRLAGRFHRVGPWIFDVAHNPSGARTIGETIAATSVARPLWALVSVLRDKDWQGILTALAPQVDGFVITDAPTAPESRRWDSLLAADAARATGRPVHHEPDFDAAIRWALERAVTVLVTGSFHTVGDVMERLPLDPLAR